MSNERAIADLIADAQRACEHARATRKAHARKTKPNSPQRKTDIGLAQERLSNAMRPIRRKIARIPYEPPTIDVKGLKAASQAIQTERRKLWKMVRPRKRRN